MATEPPAERRTVTIVRVFDVPRDLVWQAWTDPAHVARWWGPKGFDVTACEIDLRPGGAFLIQMRGPDGALYPTTGVFEEAVPPERLVAVSRAFADDDGDPRLEVRNTVTFVERGGKTELTLQAVVVNAGLEVVGALDGMEEGWSECFAKLAVHLAGETAAAAAG